MKENAIEVYVDEIVQDARDSYESLEPPIESLKVETPKEALSIFNPGPPTVDLNDPTELVKVNVVSNTLQKTIEDPTRNDKLIESIKNEDPGTTVLNNIMLELAEEIAFMKAWRNNNFQIDKDITSDMAEKRIKALSNLTSVVMDKIKIASLGSKGKVDFYSENFSKIFEYFLKVVQETFKKVGIPDQYRNIYFSELAKQLDGFEKVAEKIYNGKKKP